jgi:hypothetical protein
MERFQSQATKVRMGASLRPTLALSIKRDWGLAHPCIATAEAAASLTSLVKDGHDAAKS